LNLEQKRVLKITMLHLQEKQAEPLQMFLGGPDGTGKSHIILALKQFFNELYISSLL
ncbi:hypothetical protein F5879DRAFT_811296, partial [Lentinula edodes]